MPYETTWEQEGCYQRYSGRVSEEDRRRAGGEIMGDARFTYIKYWIVDSLEIEEYLLNKDDAFTAAAFDLGEGYTNSKILMVFVATNTDHRDNILHFTKLLETGQSPWKVKLFDDIESARYWISETLKR